MNVRTPGASEPSEPHVRGWHKETYVKLPGPVTLALSLRDRDPQAWERVLAAARRLDTRAECLCRSAERASLYVRRMDSNKHVLARFPKSHASHDPRCTLYEALPESSGRGDYASEALHERQDGDLTLHLECGIDAKDDEREPAVACATLENALRGERRNKIKLRGLLDLLWERDGLDRWTSARPRTWYNVATAIRRSAERIHPCARTTLDRRLLVITPKPAGAYVADVVATWDDARERRGARVVIVGQLERRPHVSDGKRAAVIRLVDAYRYDVTIFAAPAVVDAFNASYSRELAALRETADSTEPHSDADRLIVVALVEIDRSNGAERRGNVRAMAVRRMTSTFVPVDSAYESLFARELISRGRVFRKPLRYDGEDLFPDFELLDCGEPAYPMEVFGMQTQEYLARKRMKSKLYADRFGARWYAWNAAACEPLPELPRATV